MSLYITSREFKIFLKMALAVDILVKQKALRVVDVTDKGLWFIFITDYKRCARLLTRLAVSPMCMEG